MAIRDERTWGGDTSSETFEQVEEARELREIYAKLCSCYRDGRSWPCACPCHRIEYLLGLPPEIA